MPPQLGDRVLDLIPRVLDMERDRLQQREQRKESRQDLALLVLDRLESLRLCLVELAQERRSTVSACRRTGRDEPRSVRQSSYPRRPFEC